MRSIKLSVLAGLLLTSTLVQASVECPDKSIVGKQIGILGNFNQYNPGQYEWRRDFQGKEIPLVEKRYDERMWKVYGKNLYSLPNPNWLQNNNKNYVFSAEPERQGQGAHLACIYKIEPKPGTYGQVSNAEFVFVTLDESLQKLQTKSYASKMIQELTTYGSHQGLRSNLTRHLKPTPTYETNVFGETRITYDQGSYHHRISALEGSSMVALSHDLTTSSTKQLSQNILKSIG